MHNVYAEALAGLEYQFHEPDAKPEVWLTSMISEMGFPIRIWEDIRKVLVSELGEIDPKRPKKVFRRNLITAALLAMFISLLLALLYSSKDVRDSWFMMVMTIAASVLAVLTVTLMIYTEIRDLKNGTVQCQQQIELYQAAIKVLDKHVSHLKAENAPE